MYFDRQNLFTGTAAGGTDYTEMTGAAGDYETEALDLVTAGINPGSGELVRIFCQVIVAFAGGTSMIVKVVTDTVATLASPTIIYETESVLTATMVAGYRFAIPAIPVANLAERYFGLVFTTTGTFTGAGTNQVVAGIVHDEQQNDSGWPGVAAVTGF
jgi:hypothetical protein